MQTFRKYLLYEYVPVMEKKFGSGARESCVAQRSIYVILRGNEVTRNYINQVRNVLTYLLSANIYKCIVIRGALFQNNLYISHLTLHVNKEATILKHFCNEFSHL
jgi:hypothetical protein